MPCLPRFFLGFQGRNGRTEDTKRTGSKETIRFREFREFRGSTLITIRVKQNYNSSAQSMTESKRQWCASQKSQPINRGSLQPQTLSAFPIS
ncbi:hypothetical protein EVA_09446 [gut metagenome]|uniref:Uncharacterized protein n=1 Tax=gut metagenome TaxID=749906 RepID=J9GQV1_9ZZZZ